MDAVLGIFVASLAGSPHCAAMCGPFVAFAAADAASPGRRWPALASYHLGRLVAYAALGAAAGTLGAGVERLGVLAGVSRLAAIVAGGLMVAWAVDTMRSLRGHRSRLHPPAALGRAASRLTRSLRELPDATRAGVVGLASGLLPCGWLYAYVAAAGGTGSPSAGVLVMAVFWTGTVPVLAGLGLGLQRLAGPLRRSLPMVTASVVMVIGLLTIAGRLRPASMGPHPAAAAMVHDQH